MRRTTVAMSNASEKHAAKETGARRQIASGAKKFAKGDLIDDRFLYEDKTTDAAQYPLKKAILQKLNREALQHRRLPVLRVTVQGETVYVLPKYTFIELKNGQAG